MPIRTFDEWFRREDYGDRDQLESCWASEQNAQALIDITARSTLAQKVLEIVKAEQDDSERRGPNGHDDEFDQGRCSSSNAIARDLCDLFKREGIEVE
jgi:hypothetical protein